MPTPAAHGGGKSTGGTDAAPPPHRARHQNARAACRRFSGLDPCGLGTWAVQSIGGGWRFRRFLGAPCDGQSPEHIKKPFPAPFRCAWEKTAVRAVAPLGAHQTPPERAFLGLARIPFNFLALPCSATEKTARKPTPFSGVGRRRAVAYPVQFFASPAKNCAAQSRSHSGLSRYRERRLRRRVPQRDNRMADGDVTTQRSRMPPEPSADE
jgi:hypothetical protein